jgi:AcrR family transcriptional regulator
LTADVRRAAIVADAMPLFAVHGYHGTTTDAVAGAAGVSQPYVVRLFGSKRSLFVAVVDAAFGEIGAALVDARRSRSPGRGIDDLREVYRDLSFDSDALLIVVQALAASVDDERVRLATQEHIRAIHKTAWSAAGGDTDQVREFFGLMMLLNAVAAVGVEELLGPDW